MASCMLEQEDNGILGEPGHASLGAESAPGIVDLSHCQPTPRDYDHTLRVIHSCTDAIEQNPGNGRAYGDRALALAFLGRDIESSQDLYQAIQLGLNRRELKEEVKLVRKIAMPNLPPDNGDSPRSVMTSKHWSVTFPRHRSTEEKAVAV